MARAWFSYVVLAIGLMMLVASDKQSIADSDKESVSTKVMSFGDAKDVQVFVNKMGNDDAVVELMLNGNKHSFTIPELTDGETKTFTTDDGSEVTVKAINGSQMVWIGGEEIKLPGLHKREIGKEGLSSVITRIHEVSDFAKDTVTISGTELSDDAKKAMVDAIQGVLVSYGIEKEVMFRDAPKFEFIHADGKKIDLSGHSFDLLNSEDVDVKVEMIDGQAAENVVILKKEIKEKKEQ